MARRFSSLGPRAQAPALQYQISYLPIIPVAYLLPLTYSLTHQ